MWSNTKFTRGLGIDLPIVQGPFGGKISSVELTSTVSNAGCLGSFGCQPYHANEIVDIVNQIKNKTKNKFNLNLWVNDRDESISDFSQYDFDKVIKLLEPYFEAANIKPPTFPKDLGPQFEDQIEAVFSCRPAIISFVYGIPNTDILLKCKQLNITTIGTATTLDEAIAIENAGMDMVVATGTDAGGHRVSFLQESQDSLVGTFSLIPQVADHVKIPIIAAGGIVDARGVKAAFELGADAVQIGTAFLATKQSGTTNLHREKLFSKEARYTTLTKIFSGRLSRGMRSKLTDQLNEFEKYMAPYPIQSKIMSALGAYQNNSEKSAEFKSFWAGQAAPLLKFKDANELIKSIVLNMGS